LRKATAKTTEPRKTPVQARSTASVDAILQATIQVLLKDGKSKLTTTRIARRAGVSVGTLYQYFPNKSALLQALLKAHLDSVALAMETACEAAHGARLAEMAEAITSAFVKAKFRDLDASVALYAVSDDVEGKRLARAMHVRATKAMSTLFQTAIDKRIQEPDVVAATLLGAMAGVSRAMLEKELSREAMATLEKELTVMLRAYLEASAENCSEMLTPAIAGSSGRS
jgi:AcrR family transcriptional regulator